MKTIKRLALVLMTLIGGPIAAAILGGTAMYILYAAGVPESAARGAGDLVCWAVILCGVLPAVMRAALPE